MSTAAGGGAGPAARLTGLMQEMFGCPPDTAASIAARAAARAWPPRHPIVRQGEAADGTYLLLAGSTRATLVAPDGRLVRLHDLSPGDLFGAIDAAVEQPADVTTLAEAETARFAAADFIALVETHACVGLLLSRSLVRRLGWMTERLLERSTLSANGRVYAELLRLARAADGRTIRPAPMLSEVAQRVQTTRETASRAVADLERKGIVRREDGTMTVVAPHRLEELVY